MNASGTRARTWSGLIGMVSGFVALSFALVGLVVVWVEHRSLIGEIQMQSDRLQRLEALALVMPNALKERDLNERVVHDVLRHCRSVNDIPDLAGEHIVSVLRSTDGFKVFLYVPAGVHAMDIVATWHRDVEDPEIQSNTTERSSWSVPLVGASGYVLRVEPDVGPSFGWELLGNHEDFAESAEIPVGAFAPSGWSWGSDRVFAFPNEEWRRRGSAAVLQPGVTIMDSALRGRLDEQPYVMRIRVRIRTDGPRAISARGATGFLGKKYDQLDTYKGGGKYLLRE